MRFITASGAAGLPIVSGRSSGVERNLAKVDVVSSNLIARSRFPFLKPIRLFDANPVSVPTARHGK